MLKKCFGKTISRLAALLRCHYASRLKTGLQFISVSFWLLPAPTNKWFKTPAFVLLVELCPHLTNWGSDLYPYLKDQCSLSTFISTFICENIESKGQLRAEKRNEAWISAKTDSFTWKDSCISLVSSPSDVSDTDVKWFFVKLQDVLVPVSVASFAMIVFDDWNFTHGCRLRSDLR